METSKNIYSQIRENEHKLNNKIDFIITNKIFLNSIDESKQQPFLNAISQQTEQAYLILNSIDNLKRELNKTYSRELILKNGFMTATIKPFNKILFDKKGNRFKHISNITTLKDLSIYQIIKILFKTKKISYAEYINTINRLNHKESIRENNHIKKVFKELLTRNKEYLKKLNIDIDEEFKFLHYKKIINDKIQSLINCYYKTIKTQSSKNTITHLNKLDNKRFIFENIINNNKVYVYLKKSYSIDLERAYKNGNINFINKFWNSYERVIYLETNKKFLNDITIK